MSEAVKETKAQRAERLKRELNPWEAYAEIQRFAREGCAGNFTAFRHQRATEFNRLFRLATQPRTVTRIDRYHQAF